MKNSIIAKVIIFLFPLFISANIVLGNTALKDTTQKLIAASKIPAKNIAFLIKEANVVYPEILQGHEEESLEYVEKFSKNRREYLVRTYNRSKNYFPKVQKILKRYDVPQEYAVLMALESCFKANAKSSAGAYGYWQFMDDVAKEYGLRVHTVVKTTHSKAHNKNKKPFKSSTHKKAIDDRSNFIKSTNAAAKYLKDRSRNLDNDWLLIAASYNYGIGNVKNAMQKTGKENPSFWDIKKYLPAETKSYVMNFIALNVIFNNYDKFIKNELIFTDEYSRDIELDAVLLQSLSALPGSL
ncbi:MAG: lytic transglycosylase domain-containing protein [Chitinophagaceae bacterium]|jgi:membrane-bound lytic murein transglycosylase D|nr:lytic transglycosylase domain-containing protein [Chitinophagaceae bacterium]MBP6046721.1 lytic transglycosylase domain-containing protein [Ferruginibacter sp.]NMD28395.1 lytic transglycosylase domain-containing protein [Bacteroidota bacterium]MBK7088831.1 lytic transglycosylase domain-containing protein [Chitinophagaceae bacterium]MBK7347980.1 lytic transglycosylase domain-containing protein [Chitinophagaceae bacterium]